MAVAVKVYMYLNIRENQEDVSLYTGFFNKKPCFAFIVPF